MGREQQKTNNKFMKNRLWAVLMLALMMVYQQQASARQDTLMRFDPSEITELIAQGVTVIDTRERQEVAAGYHSQTIHIELNEHFNKLFEQVVGPGPEVVFIVDREKEQELRDLLEEAGIDQVLGLVNEVSDSAVKTISYVQADDLLNAVEQDGVQAWDIRTPEEYAEEHIAGFKNLPLSEIAEKAAGMDKHQPVILHCQSGVRAAVGYSIFERLGFKDIRVYDGGIKEWKAMGKALVTEQ